MERTQKVFAANQLRRAVAEGNLGQALHALIDYVEGSETPATTEVYLASARFRKLELEKQRGEISVNDHKTEFSSITYSLLEIIDQLSELDPHYFSEVPSMERIRAEIEELAQEFHQAMGIKSPLSRLRTQIHIARRMAEKMLLWPELLRSYQNTDDEALMCAIGRKVKIVADIEDLDVLEAIAPRAQSLVTKGFLTNALAELIYSGQLRIGDDVRVRYLCDVLGKDGDMVLLTNVDRVIAMVDFMTGKR